MALWQERCSKDIARMI